jgi:hypothetical protein
MTKDFLEELIEERTEKNSEFPRLINKGYAKIKLGHLDMIQQEFIRDLKRLSADYIGKSGKVFTCVQDLGSFSTEDRTKIGEKINVLTEYVKEKTRL